VTQDDRGVVGLVSCEVLVVDIIVEPVVVASLDCFVNVSTDVDRVDIGVVADDQLGQLLAKLTIAEDLTQAVIIATKELTSSDKLLMISKPVPRPLTNSLFWRAMIGSFTI
jgi:hypothetical protein